MANDTSDDTTKAILATHAAILDNLAAGQVTIAQSLQALVGVVELQQSDAVKTSKALTDLAAGVRLNQQRAEKARAQIEADRQRIMEQAGIQPR